MDTKDIIRCNCILILLNLGIKLWNFVQVLLFWKIDDNNNNLYILSNSVEGELHRPTRSRPNSWTGLKNKKRQPKRQRVGDLVTTDYGFPNCNRLRLTRNLHKRSSSKPPTSMRRLASQLTTVSCLFFLILPI